MALRILPKPVHIEMTVKDKLDRMFGKFDKVVCGFDDHEEQK